MLAVPNWVVASGTRGINLVSRPARILLRFQQPRQGQH